MSKDASAVFSEMSRHVHYFIVQSSSRFPRARITYFGLPFVEVSEIFKFEISELL